MTAPALEGVAIGRTISGGSDGVGSFYFDASGRFFAGAGFVELGQSGIKITADETGSGDIVFDSAIYPAIKKPCRYCGNALVLDGRGACNACGGPAGER